MTDVFITDTAERVKLDSEEDGFHLLVKSADGQWYDFNIHGIDLDTFYDQVKGRIGPYLQEKEEAFQEFKRARAAGAFECDQDKGYSRDDPKHPAFHSTHADIWDSREGK